MQSNTYALRFQGKGLDFFKIQIVNLILCMLTLGLYYPWAKVKTLSYLYNQTVFEEQPFVFTGTGSEMFRGFIKAILFFLLLYVAVVCLVIIGKGSGWVQLVLLGFYFLLLALVPLVLHGSYRYRMAKTVWRGIRFGYTGNRAALVKLFFKGLFFTIITFGIYGAWFSMNLRKYLLDHVKMGNASFRYEGNGGDYFILNLKGYFLTIFTLGIYFFWWQKNLFDYFINNLHLSEGEKKVKFTSTATGGDFAALLIVNLLIILFTLGLGYAWVVTRTLVFATNHIQVNGDMRFDELAQTQQDYSDATATDFADLLDFGFIV